MEKNEIQAMFTRIDGAYRSDKVFTEEQTKIQLSEWYRLFKDDDSKTVAIALDYELTHNHFKPNIADIKGAMRKRATASATELWRELQSAAKRGSRLEYKNYKSRSHYTNEFEKLPPILKTYIRNAKGLKEFYETEHNTFDKKQFEKEIRELQEAGEQLMIAER